MQALADYSSSDEDEGEGGVEASAAAGRVEHGTREAGLCPGLVYLELTAEAAAAVARVRPKYMLRCEAVMGSKLLGFCEQVGGTSVSAGVASRALPVDSIPAPKLRPLPDPDAYVETPLHISLSRFFTLRIDSAEAFVDHLRAALAGAQPFEISLEGSQLFTSSIAFARARSDFAAAVGSLAPSVRRVYLAMPVGGGCAEVCGLISRLDATMKAFQLPVFYSNPEPHASIAFGSALCQCEISGRRRPTYSAASSICDGPQKPPGVCPPITACLPREPQHGSCLRCEPNSAGALKWAGGRADDTETDGCPLNVKRQRVGEDAGTDFARRSADVSCTPQLAAFDGELEWRRRKREGCTCLDFCASAVEAGVSECPSPRFFVIGVVCRIGKHVFRLPLSSLDKWLTGRSSK